MVPARPFSPQQRAADGYRGEPPSVGLGDCVWPGLPGAGSESGPGEQPPIQKPQAPAVDQRAAFRMSALNAQVQRWMAADQPPSRLSWLGCCSAMVFTRGVAPCGLGAASAAALPDPHRLIGGGSPRPTQTAALAGGCLLGYGGGS